MQLQLATLVTASVCTALADGWNGAICTGQRLDPTTYCSHSRVKFKRGFTARVIARARAHTGKTEVPKKLRQEPTRFLLASIDSERSSRGQTSRRPVSHSGPRFRNRPRRTRCSICVRHCVALPCIARCLLIFAKESFFSCENKRQSFARRHKGSHAQFYAWRRDRRRCGHLHCSRLFSPARARAGRG